MSSFDDLMKQYGDFSVPAFKIMVGGSELSKSDFIVNDISVDLAMGTTCGACRLHISGVYDRTSRSFSSEAIKKLKIGNTIGVHLGYGSTLKSVFFGYIHEMKISISGEGQHIILYGLDARALMRESSGRTIYSDKKMADVVNDVLKKYSKLAKAEKINVKSLEEETSIVLDGDDLSFLFGVCEKRGLLLYIDDNKFYMDNSSKETALSIDWEQFIEIEFGLSYLDVEMTGLGCDITSNKPFTVTKKAKQKASQETLITVKQVAPLPHYMLGENGGSSIEARCAAMESSSVNGKVTFCGIPEPMLGKKIKINKFPLSDTGVGNTFSIVSVSHIMNGESGYKTTVGLSG